MTVEYTDKISAIQAAITNQRHFNKTFYVVRWPLNVRGEIFTITQVKPDANFTIIDAGVVEKFAHLYGR
jgi:hypothetical protein